MVIFIGVVEMGERNNTGSPAVVKLFGPVVGRFELSPGSCADHWMRSHSAQIRIDADRPNRLQTLSGPSVEDALEERTHVKSAAAPRSAERAAPGAPVRRTPAHPPLP